MNFRELRQRAGLTQMELARKIGRDQTTISQIERGAVRSPGYFLVVDIASALKVKPSVVGDAILNTEAA